MVVDWFTGKFVDKPSDNLSSRVVGQYCDECGTELINRCSRCGAPLCCPKCCEKDEQVYLSAKVNLDKRGKLYGI